MNQVSTKHRTQQVHIAAKIISSSPASKFLNLESLMSVSILRDILGSSALHLAFMTGNVGLASVLLKYGADLYVFCFSFVLFHLSLQIQIIRIDTPRMHMVIVYWM